MFGNKKHKPHRAPGHYDTLVSSRTSVDGDVIFSGGLHVDGRVRGRVTAEEGSDAVVRVSEVGEVEGDISAPHVIINGTVHGDVYATAHLELAEKASIKGNVYYHLIQMAMGAQVNGSLVHRKESAGLLQAAEGAGNRQVEEKERNDREHYDSDEMELHPVAAKAQ